jgi:glyoxylase-like metal-dependent hydrolase (beta-lactamase superfamily II)
VNSNPHEQDAHTVGQATVTHIRELTLANITPAALFPDWDAGVLADHPDWLPPEAMDESREHILLSVHSWLIQESGRTILIDTGAGNGKKRPYAPYFDRLNNPFLERLRAVGVAPEDIDYVLLTHLHVDHVGWNTRLEGGSWVPTFPKARYIFSRAEHAYFTDPQNQTARNRTTFQVQKDSVEPIIKSGLADMIEIDGSESIKGFTFHPTPGHSFAHASIAFRSGAEQALFAGDVLHCPLEVYKPDWNTVFDAFPEEARESRMWALKFAADHEAMIFSSHFTASSAGNVLRDGSGFRWRFR